jgi:hypothetical protein
MLQRLYFTTPDAASARRLVADLMASGIDRTALHAVRAAATLPDDLPRATVAQERDTQARIERVLWAGLLALFFIALAGFFVAWFGGSRIGTAVTVLIMAASFVGGALYAVRVPSASLDELRNALAHGEIVLMVDVPRARIAEITTLVERRHPETTPAGTGWTLGALGV